MKGKSILTTIPGIWPSLAHDLNRLWVFEISDLIQKDPEALYQRLCELDGPTDRCVLYTFRCAVYFAEQIHSKHSLDWLSKSAIMQQYPKTKRREWIDKKDLRE